MKSATNTTSYLLVALILTCTLPANAETSDKTYLCKKYSFPFPIKETKEISEMEDDPDTLFQDSLLHNFELRKSKNEEFPLIRKNPEYKFELSSAGDAWIAHESDNKRVKLIRLQTNKSLTNSFHKFRYFVKRRVDSYLIFSERSNAMMLEGSMITMKNIRNKMLPVTVSKRSSFACAPEIKE